MDLQEMLCFYYQAQKTEKKKIEELKKTESESEKEKNLEEYGEKEKKERKLYQADPIKSNRKQKQCLNQ